MQKQKTFEEVSQDYLNKIKQKLPTQKAKYPFIIGIIGLIGSGKTTVAKMLEKKLTGAVLLRSDSARFLLNKAGLEYKVREVIYPAVKWLLQEGYSVISDSDFVDNEKRKKLEEFAHKHNTKLYFIRIVLNKDFSLKRLQNRWEDVETGKIKQNFDNFLVVTRGKEDNLFRRVPLHESLQDKDIDNLIGIINNNSTLEDLEKQVGELVKDII